MQVFRDYRLIECETTMRRLTPIAIREVAVFDTEEVVPVVHAHWTNKRTDIHDGEFYCSRCGIDALYFSDDGAQAIYNPYCHRCGAKMDEEVDDG